MTFTKTPVLSCVRDEIIPASHMAERGVRYWTSVEIRSDSWFQIETCCETPDGFSIKSLITSDFRSAKATLPRVRGNRWEILRMYARTPSLSQVGYLFEPVKQVFELKNGKHLFLLESGVMLQEEGSSESSSLSLEEARTVYSSR
jgi:hypothetical protein